MLYGSWKHDDKAVVTYYTADAATSAAKPLDNTTVWTAADWGDSPSSQSLFERCRYFSDGFLARAKASPLRREMICSHQQRCRQAQVLTAGSLTGKLLHKALSMSSRSTRLKGQSHLKRQWHAVQRHCAETKPVTFVCSTQVDFGTGADDDDDEGGGRRRRRARWEEAGRTDGLTLNRDESEALTHTLYPQRETRRLGQKLDHGGGVGGGGGAGCVACTQLESDWENLCFHVMYKTSGPPSLHFTSVSVCVDPAAFQNKTHGMIGRAVTKRRTNTGRSESFRFIEVSVAVKNSQHDVLMAKVIN
ncbi:hypothetical protein D9C73_019342 [Collichthys lucidus]|uniref:Uncharacterized protein n=1 Tax=Collichthys lucidus TaxID=240159 RepID=A0A4U5VEB1_COLLU|nr:hypothetical protein D9C73_019342 [Collichthys lucidus]